jgi:hypothetical protein
MVQSRDVIAIRALLERQGLDVDELELARLVRFDPRRRAVICASALVGLTETIVGIGAIDLDALMPDTLLVDDELTDGLRELLSTALLSRASARAA